jgi:hypothetical protein
MWDEDVLLDRAQYYFVKDEMYYRDFVYYGSNWIGYTEEALDYIQWLY